MKTPPPPLSPATSRTGSLARRFAHHLWREWIRPLAIPFLLISAAKSALADINFVPTGSMQPTILEGDVVFINKLAYDLRVPFTFARVAEWSAPARGDIVVCYSPADGMRLVKRVVALPGDVVELRDDVVWLNGQPQSYGPIATDTAGITEVRAGTREPTAFSRETLAASGPQTPAHPHLVMALPQMPALRNFGPVRVPAGSYFVLGDNRDNSADSRYFGFMPRERIVGEAQAVFVSAKFRDGVRLRFERFCTPLE